MYNIYFYLVLAGLLTILQWTPYIVARLFVWGPALFLKNYPNNFPKEVPEQPLWAERAQRAHLNMVETMPAFIAVALGAGLMAENDSSTLSAITSWCSVFLIARIAYAVVYILGLPYLRTPVYLVSWFSILAIGFTALV